MGFPVRLPSGPMAPLLCAVVLLVMTFPAHGQSRADPPPNTVNGETAETEREPYSLETTRWLTGDWGGARTWMEDSGVKPSFIYTGVWQQNLRGGLNTHNADDFNADLRINVYLDLDRMDLIPGAFFFIRGKSSYNNSVRSEVGSLSSTSWVVASGDEEFFLDKWWYGQRFFDDRLEFRVGKLLTPVDLFDANDYAKLPWDQFLSAALNRNPTVPHRKAPAAFLKYRPTDLFYVQALGVNADQRDSTRAVSFDTTFHNKYGGHNPRFIGMWEFGVTPTFQGPSGALPGNYRFGAWYDPRPGPVFRNTFGGRLTRIKTRGNDVGFYVSFDQLLWKESDDPRDKQGLGAFLRYGFAHRDINAVSNFWSIGAQYQGLLPKRHNDVLAFGVAQSILSDRLRDDMNPLADRETVYEIYYAIHLTPWLVLTPDIQVISNPGGTKDARDALVGSLRAKISF